LGSLSDALEPIAGRIRETLTQRDAARERVLPLCRDVIRHCSKAIRAVHRQEVDEARTILQSARDLLDEIDGLVEPGSELARAGLVRDAHKEYTEGMAVLAIVRGERPPEPEELKTDPVDYLHGLGDTVGELRRYLLDSMRKGDLSRGEEFLSAMDDIYSILITMDFPDALTGGLRRATDMVRGILERTRSDLTLTTRQSELESRLARIENPGKEDIL
jgi:translin